jgi:hypothetical protein
MNLSLEALLWTGPSSTIGGSGIRNTVCIWSQTFDMELGGVTYLLDGQPADYLLLHGCANVCGQTVLIILSRLICLRPKIFCDCTTTCAVVSFKQEFHMSRC